MSEETDVNTRTGIKLINDFGIRALIAMTMITGYIGSATYAIYLGNTEMLMNITSLYSPLIASVITFYFLGSTLRDAQK